ncbi:MAG: hypothetical protein HY811_09445 [Planctomycetes bacterium]|nr:hypothetical protein [Planctomycetota bacterium]
MKLKVLAIGLLILGLSFGFYFYANGQDHNGPGEHPGVKTEHPGMKEHPGEKVTPEDVRKGINDYIKKDSELKGGYFLVYDAKEMKTWTLQLSKVHDWISLIKKEDAYFTCCDFTEICGECLIGKKHDIEKHHKMDIDFWMKKDGKKFEVFRIVIHKLDGAERHTYQDDEIAPVK